MKKLAIRYIAPGEKRITTVFVDNYEQLEQYRSEHNITCFNIEIVSQEAVTEYLGRTAN